MEAASRLMRPLVVLIATHGRCDLLERTLDSLAGCVLPESYAGAIVVENGSRDRAEAVVGAANRRSPDLRLRYLHVAEANKSLALNHALGTLRDALVLFLDDDVRVHPRLLVRYAEAAEGTDGGAFFGGSCGVDYQERPPEWLIPLLPYSARGMDLRTDDRMWEYLGCNWAAFARDLRAAGLFSPDFGPGAPAGAVGQESDMQHRLADLGARRVDIPDLLVWHWVPRHRCSPRWFLARRLREGTSATLAARRRGRGRLRILGDTFGALARSLGALGLGTLQGNRTRIGRGIGGLVGVTGRLKGFLMAGSRERTPPAPVHQPPD